VRFPARILAIFSLCALTIGLATAQDKVNYQGARLVPEAALDALVAWTGGSVDIEATVAAFLDSGWFESVVAQRTPGEGLVIAVLEHPRLIGLAIATGGKEEPISDKEILTAAGVGRPLSMVKIAAAKSLFSAKYRYRAVDFSMQERPEGTLVVFRGQVSPAYGFSLDFRPVIETLEATTDDRHRISVGYLAPYYAMFDQSLSLPQSFVVNKLSVMVDWMGRPYPLDEISASVNLLPLSLALELGHEFLRTDGSTLVLGLQGSLGLETAPLAARTFSAGPLTIARYESLSGKIEMAAGALLTLDGDGGVEGAAAFDASLGDVLLEKDKLTLSAWAGGSSASQWSSLLLLDEYAVFPVVAGRRMSTDLAQLRKKIIGAPFMPSGDGNQGAALGIGYVTPSFEGIPLYQPGLFASLDAMSDFRGRSALAIGCGVEVTMTVFGTLRLGLIHFGFYLDAKRLLEGSGLGGELRLYGGGV